MNNAPPPGGILLATINAKWIHPSLALRLLKANLGPLESCCTIIEFALRQPLQEKIDPILAAQPRILGLSVSIWNHTATLELLENLHKAWGASEEQRPIVVLGGPEVSHLPPEAEIFRYADYCIRGEGEVAFRELCETILPEKNVLPRASSGPPVFINQPLHAVNVTEIKTAYHLYTDEDLRQKLVYVEASRGCPFVCEFCLSGAASTHSPQVQEFPLEPFLAEMDELIQRAGSSSPLTFKFLDRTFNLNIERARRIMEFFLGKIAEQTEALHSLSPLVVHFEMVPSRFPPELIETIARFPPGTLRLEIGIQTLNPEVSARIGRPANPLCCEQHTQELEIIRLLREQTSALIHADLIAGLPGEDMASFGRGFDRLWEALSTPRVLSAREVLLPPPDKSASNHLSLEIQLGILKLLPGAAIARHTGAFGMRYSPLPPYEVMETAALPAVDLAKIKNFARFWELIVNRGLINIGPSPVFDRFMALSESLLNRFGRNWGIDKSELQAACSDYGDTLITSK